MEEPKVARGSSFQRSLSPCISQRHVSYSCGFCGYELNLNSSNRNTSAIGRKYEKSMKRGIFLFVAVDESRFSKVDELQCGPYFSKNSWGLFRHRTRLLCGKCGNPIGTAYDDRTSAHQLVINKPDSPPSSETAKRRKYFVRIRSLQPSSVE